MITKYIIVKKLLKKKKHHKTQQKIYTQLSYICMSVSANV